MLVTEDIYDGESDEKHSFVMRQVQFVRAQALVEVTNVSFIFILPSVHVVPLVLVSLFDQCLLVVPEEIK